MREHHDRGRVIGLYLLKRFLGPGDDDLVGMGEPLAGREARPRVGDDRAPADVARCSAERVGRVDRAVDEQARRRAEHIREQAPAV